MLWLSFDTCVLRQRWWSCHGYGYTCLTFCVVRSLYMLDELSVCWIVLWTDIHAELVVGHYLFFVDVCCLWRFPITVLMKFSHIICHRINDVCFSFVQIYHSITWLFSFLFIDVDCTDQAEVNLLLFAMRYMPHAGSYTDFQCRIISTLLFSYSSTKSIHVQRWLIHWLFKRCRAPRCCLWGGIMPHIDTSEILWLQ